MAVNQFEKIEVTTLKQGLDVLIQISNKRQRIYSDLLMVHDKELIANLEDQLEALQVLRTDVKRQLVGEYNAY